MPADPLEDARFRVDHAKRRIQEFDTEGRAFRDSDPCTQLIEIDKKTGDKVAKVKFTKPLPRSLSGIAFDAVSNLRSALDLAGYACAVAASAKGSNAHFPFGGNVGEVQSKKKGRSRDIPQEIFDVMVACKPYKGGNDLLWALNKLCNSNKHEIVVPTLIQHGGTHIKQMTVSGSFNLGIHFDRAKQELEVARVGPGGKVDGHFQVSFFIAIGDIEPVRGQPALDTLNALAGEVERVLVAIEGEARRIGLFK